MNKLYYSIFILISFFITSCAGGWTNFTPVNQGEVIDIGHYKVTVPKGDGWSVKINKNQGFVTLKKQNIDGNVISITILAGRISDELARQSSSFISNTILSEEERGLRERGKRKNYSIYEGESYWKFVTIEGKRCYVWGYTIRDWSNDMEKQIKYAMYVYGPSDYKTSKIFYTFLIGVPLKVDFTIYKPDLTIIDSIIESFIEEK